MVDSSYMLRKPPPPGPTAVFVRQVALPKLIDAAAVLETRLEGVSVCARRAPLSAVTAAFGAGWLMMQLVRPAWRARRA